MSRKLLRWAVVLSLLVPVSGWAAGSWSKLKAGMTRTETTSVLGSALMASRGRGFEIAIYDGRAEVVYLDGQVVAWTAPAASEAPPPPANAWQFDQVTRVRANPQSGGRPGDSRSQIWRPTSILPAYRL